MELIDELDEEYWSRGDPNETTGYQHFRVMKCDKLEPLGNFSYGVFADDGMLRKVTLGNGSSKRDPLNGVCNIQLRLSENETEIVGVIVEDDCVLLKSAMTQPEPVANGDRGENGNGGTETNGEHAADDVTETNGEHATDDVTEINGEQAAEDVIETNGEHTTAVSKKGDESATAVHEISVDQNDTADLNGDETEHDTVRPEAISTVEEHSNPENT